MRNRTSFTFNTKNAADRFVQWLMKNEVDSYYGKPKYMNHASMGSYGYIVEWTYDADNKMSVGVATGIGWAELNA